MLIAIVTYGGKMSEDIFSLLFFSFKNDILLS